MPSHICQASETRPKRMESRARERSQNAGFVYFLPGAVTGSSDPFTWLAPVC